MRAIVLRSSGFKPALAIYCTLTTPGVNMVFCSLLKQIQKTEAEFAWRRPNSATIQGMATSNFSINRDHQRAAQELEQELEQDCVVRKGK